MGLPASVVLEDGLAAELNNGQRTNTEWSHAAGLSRRWYCGWVCTVYQDGANWIGRAVKSGITKAGNSTNFWDKWLPGCECKTREDAMADLQHRIEKEKSQL